MIGHFGSIYPGKQPNALLEIGANPEAARALRRCSSISAPSSAASTRSKKFYARVAELGSPSDVIVSGFVASDHEVFGLFGEIDAFCYPLDEGSPRVAPASSPACNRAGR